MLILNDLHFGVNRSAGTTKESAIALKQWLFQETKLLLDATTENELLVAGDLFDKFQVSNEDFVETYKLFDAWLEKGKKLYLMAGNHDIRGDSTQMSSFHALCELFSCNYNFMPILESKTLGDLTCIPHLPNQALFDKAFAEANTKFIIVHANYDNHFAVEADHSLNVSEEMLASKGESIVIFAHEHQARRVKNALVMGNQFPSSIADCLGGPKLFHTLRGGEILSSCCWQVKNNYVEMDWQDLYSTDARFIRVTGNVKKEQAKDCLAAIAKYRKESQAFIVGNAVQIEAREEVKDKAVTSKQEVLDMLFESLTPAQAKLIKELK